MAGRLSQKPLTIAAVGQMLTSGTTYRHNRHSLFRDFLSVATICYRNATEPKDDHWDAREAMYFEVIGRYERDVLDQMAQCMANLTILAADGYTDLLGELYMSLEIGSKDMGQFFTPYHISQLMAMISLDQSSLERAIEEHGCISMNEPTCGAGGMVVATAHTLRNLGFDPSKELRVTAQDIDFACCQMTYLNCVFFGIPATIIHGDVLALEERSVMKTPALLQLEYLDQSKAA